MTRLLQAIAGAKHGGAEAFFERLALALHRAAQVQKVVIRPDPERAALLQEAGIDLAEARFGGKLDLTTRRRLRDITREWQPDVVLTWMNRASSMMPGGTYVHVARLGGYYDLKYYRGVDHLIGNTHDIVDYLIRNGWPAERAHYLPNFVDAVPAAPLSRAALDTPEEAPLLLALGRLHRSKGFDVLLHAMASLPGVYLWLAGEGQERAALERLIADLGLAGRVHLLGWRSDVAALLAAADLLVCPSRFEPLGNVVIEAWAHRLPVVATRAAGPAALIRDGENGLLVPIDDAHSLAKSVRVLLDDAALHRDLVGFGHEEYRQHYTEAAVVTAYRDFFERVTG